MSFVAEILISFFLVVAGVFGLVGSIGLAKLRDPMSRLHGPTKATTLGVGGVVIASLIHGIVFEAEWVFHELLISLFLFLTAPVTALFIAKAHIHRHVDPKDLPQAAEDHGWAVLEGRETPEEYKANRENRAP